MQADPQSQGEWGGEFDPFADPEERRVLFAALDSFYKYGRHSHFALTHRRRQAFYALPRHDWQLLARPPISCLDKLDAIDEAISVNERIAQSILQYSLSSFGLPLFEHDEGQPQEDWEQLKAHPLNWHDQCSPEDGSKTHTIIRQFYRDWSAEGAPERQNSYSPVLDDLLSKFPTKRNHVRVLVPGAGLGRLMFEVCQRGFNVEGNEISYHALMASSWVLNHIPEGTTFGLHPWLASFTNQLSSEHQLKRVEIPDVHPGQTLNLSSQSSDNLQHGGIPAIERMSMVASDFNEEYNKPAQHQAFDAVVTVFFIDTAPNLMTYIKTVKHCLKDSGYWINLGPLQWHFGGGQSTSSGGGSEDGAEKDDTSRSNPFGPGSVELTNAEVMELVKVSGFEIESSEIRQGLSATGYIQAPNSMMQSTYTSAHWVARKAT